MLYGCLQWFLVDNVCPCMSYNLWYILLSFACIDTYSWHFCKMFHKLDAFTLSHDYIIISFLWWCYCSLWSTGLHFISFVAFGSLFSLFEKLGSLCRLWHAFVHSHDSLDSCIANKGERLYKGENMLHFGWNVCIAFVNKGLHLCMRDTRFRGRTWVLQAHVQGEYAFVQGSSFDLLCCVLVVLLLLY